MADASYEAGADVPAGTLYRRIYPSENYYKGSPDNRATSLNFLPDRGEQHVSMFRAAETTPSEVLDGHDGFGLLAVEAEILWGLGCRVIYQPEYGKGHVGVLGFTKKDEQRRRNAAVASRVLVAPRFEPR